MSDLVKEFMPLRIFKCPICGNKVKTLKKSAMPPICAHEKPDANIDADYIYMEEVLTAPTSKLMETTDKNMGKSKIKGLAKTLKARSRNFARDFEARDLVDFNRKNNIEKSGFLGKDGKLRKKLDDK
jgi:hypothetical protein